MILVTGSTGLMGSQIVAKARRQGLPVRAMARPTAAAERLQAIRDSGAELAWGDLKDRESLVKACTGVNAVISTASSTLSRQPGDNIESVDRAGQIALVDAARSAGVSHFTYFGVGHRYGDSPLINAKIAFEQAVQASGMRWTNLEGAPFMEVWLSPALGFDWPNRKAVVFGSGDHPISWVSMLDLAEAAVQAHRLPKAADRTIEACGPEALSANQVIGRFEAALRGEFAVQRVPLDALATQFESATDPLQKTFAGLQMAVAQGLSMDPREFVETFGLRLRSLDDYIATGLKSVAG